jgi:membrane protease YdiL (CAAX protease family)
MKTAGYFLKHKNLIYSFSILFFSIVFVYLGCFASMGLIRIHLSHFAGLKADYSSSFYGQVFLLILLFLALRVRGEKNYLNITFQAKDLRDSILLFFGGYLFVCFLAVVGVLAFTYSTKDFDVLQPTESLKSVVAFLAHLSFWKMTVFLAVNAIFEESIIRALFMNELNGFIRQGALIVVVSALVQAGYHLYQGWARCLLVFFLFLIFAAYYQKFRRTTPLILAHFFVDFSSFALLKALKVEL